MAVITFNKTMTPVFRKLEKMYKSVPLTKKETDALMAFKTDLERLNGLLCQVEDNDLWNKALKDQREALKK